jgi:hypothetical protein
MAARGSALSLACGSAIAADAGGDVAMRMIFGFSLLVAIMAAAPAAAQGTSRQRSACTNDAYRFCEHLVPDADAVAQCLKSHLGSLSRPCRAQILGASKAKKRGRRH